MAPEIEWDVVDEVEWGIEEDIVWEETDEDEETILELRNDSQPSFFVRKFAVVWWRNGFYKAGKVDGSIRVTPSRTLFFDEKGKLRLSINNSDIKEIKLHEHESDFSIFYNEIITDKEVYEITTGVDKAQSEQNHKALESAISGNYEEPLKEIIDLKIVTSNNGKIKEFIDIFEKTHFNPVKTNIDYPEIQASSLEEVVDFGLSWLQGKIKPPFVIDDAGAFIDNLHGFPGVYSRYVYDTIGLEGVLKQMENVDERKCTFRCVLGLMTENGEKHKFVGECKGVLIDEQRGDGGFGYDPIFIPEGLDKTFAELPPEEKNSISHRGIAMRKLIDFLLK